ncbi:23S rRNA (guanosine(2251)-2'-O)-methyltransferase RlmB [Neokomagataea anthophila]|uniref:23S rRNA (Guanosine(2251)-2'-O)-methyltransferase RlmB n=1 Tax=Neokomagataea anthophila TaxID=2826925 RepID=A0ABS5E8A9_9PROT|nr:23S rRNA (guanosine(2251)-2'-O)-methyltransferase RlmB [Neokomagataea anthophila]MBR0560143.1 23S rRNA (guanosine(2251)-2'-O)-methyltransferase RlmB [Neokomagataea anthophila]
MARRTSSPSPKRISLPKEHDASAPSRAGRPTRNQPGYWIYGHHAVEAALDNPERVIHEFLATQEASAQFAHARVSPQVVDRERLDRLCDRDAVHQGVCLRVEPLTPPHFLDALSRPGPVLVLDQVTDPRNIGAILRSAAAFGACAVLVQDRNTPQESGSMAKAASGALDIVPILREVNLSRALASLQREGLWIVGLDAGGTRLDGTTFSGRRIALVLGAEGAGLRRLTRETCDEIASVYMPGNMESLNVSNAAAVALYELARPS